MQTGSEGGGAALEHIVQLCNMVGAAPWISVPYIAGEDPGTLRAMAALLRDRLRPDVPVYVEYSNEVRAACCVLLGVGCVLAAGAGLRSGTYLQGHKQGLRGRGSGVIV